MSKYFIICKCKICVMNVSEMVNKHILQNKVPFPLLFGVNNDHGPSRKSTSWRPQ